MKPQEKNNYCVCAVLQDLLLNNGLVLSQDDIAKKLTPSERGYYVDDKKIKEFLFSEGFSYNYYAYNATPFNEPDVLLEDIKNNFGFFGVGGHTYKITNFNDPELEFIDPLDASLGRKNLYDSMSDMKLNFGFFGLIKRLK